MNDNQPVVIQAIQNLLNEAMDEKANLLAQFAAVAATEAQTKDQQRPLMEQKTQIKAQIEAHEQQAQGFQVSILAPCVDASVPDYGDVGPSRRRSRRPRRRGSRRRATRPTMGRSSRRRNRRRRMQTVSLNRCRRSLRCVHADSQLPPRRFSYTLVGMDGKGGALLRSHPEPS